VNLSKKIVWLTLILSASLYSFAALAQTAIIVHPSNSNSNLSTNVIKKIFLAKKDTFPNGAKATPVDQPESSGIRPEFYQAVANKSEAQMKSYWSRMIFSGKGVPPDVLDDDAAVKNWVSANKGGIGYIDNSQVDATVKVILLIP